MALAVAARNICDSYRLQFRLRGSLLPRLGYVTCYWGSYLFSNRLGRNRGDAGQAHVFALEFLKRMGLSNREVRFELPDGTKFCVDFFTSNMIIKEIYGDDMYSIGGMGDFKLQPGQTVFDIGAQQGVFTMIAARQVAHGKVIAIEPEPGNFNQIKQNIALNRFAHVTPIQVALSDKTGNAKLFRSKHDSGGNSLTPHDAAKDSIEVRVSTLDTLVSELGFGPDFLKIDVEGQTLAVLKGGTALLERFRPNIAMEVEVPAQMEEITALLNSFGYRSRVLGGILFAQSPSRVI